MCYNKITKEKEGKYKMIKKIKNWLRYQDTVDIILYGMAGLCIVGIIGLVVCGILIWFDVIQIADNANAGFNVAGWVVNPANPASPLNHIVP